MQRDVRGGAEFYKPSGPFQYIRLLRVLNYGRYVMQPSLLSDIPSTSKPLANLVELSAHTTFDTPLHIWKSFVVTNRLGFQAPPQCESTHSIHCGREWQISFFPWHPPDMWFDLDFSLYHNRQISGLHFISHLSLKKYCFHSRAKVLSSTIIEHMKKSYALKGTTRFIKFSATPHIPLPQQITSTDEVLAWCLQPSITHHTPYIQGLSKPNIIQQTLCHAPRACIIILLPNWEHRREFFSNIGLNNTLRSGQTKGPPNIRHSVQDSMQRLWMKSCIGTETVKRWDILDIPLLEDRLELCRCLDWACMAVRTQIGRLLKCLLDSNQFWVSKVWFRVLAHSQRTTCHKQRTRIDIPHSPQDLALYPICMFADACTIVFYQLYPNLFTSLHSFWITHLYMCWLAKYTPSHTDLYKMYGYSCKNKYPAMIHQHLFWGWKYNGWGVKIQWLYSCTFSNS